MEEQNCAEKRITKEMEEILSKYSKQKDSLIAILNEVQEKYGYIPKQSQMEIANTSWKAVTARNTQTKGTAARTQTRLIDIGSVSMNLPFSK